MKKLRSVVVSVAASSGAAKLGQLKQLAIVPLADAQIRRDLALVFRKDKALSRAALAFIDIAVKIKTADSVASGKR